MSSRKVNSAFSEAKSQQKAERCWQHRASNKKQKKKIVQGEAATISKSSCKSPEKIRRKKASVAPRPTMASLVECFSEVVDPRLNRRRRHLLIDIIVIALLATICNANTWKDIQIWGSAREQWLNTFLELPNGIPSRDTFRRTISRIDPQQFQQAFLNWLKGVNRRIKGVVAIDGKTLRRSGSKDRRPLHIVSAWASEQHLTLGQRTVEGKSNEITAIPELLAALTLKGAIVTIDAMGCQKNIAEQILACGADYCLAVKDNQPTLAADILQSFVEGFEDDEASSSVDEYETWEKSHGRTEQRQYFIMPVGETMSTAKEWKGLKSIGMVITHRHADTDEDESRIHKDHGGENVSWLRRLAITLIKRDTTIKDSIRAKRVRAGYNIEFLQQMLACISGEN